MHPLVAMVRAGVLPELTNRCKYLQIPLSTSSGSPVISKPLVRAPSGTDLQKQGVWRADPVALYK